jgi:hypothetical protein
LKQTPELFKKVSAMKILLTAILLFGAFCFSANAQIQPVKNTKTDGTSQVQLYQLAFDFIRNSDSTYNFINYYYINSGEGIQKSTLSSAIMVDDTIGRYYTKSIFLQQIIKMTFDVTPESNKKLYDSLKISLFREELIKERQLKAEPLIYILPQLENEALCNSLAVVYFTEIENSILIASVSPTPNKLIDDNLHPGNEGLHFVFKIENDGIKDVEVLKTIH